jgi:D-3-phosphoglycerate dehydrogenase / 2-oxoglutarate reductase
LKEEQLAFWGSELQGKTLTVIGLGDTGLEVAKRAKSFGMQVIAVTRNPFLKKPGIDKAYFVDNIGLRDPFRIYC